MADIAYNGTAAVFAPLQSTVTITPSGGSVKWRASDRTGTRFSIGEITAAADVELEPGWTLYIQCFGGTATYSGDAQITTPDGAVVALSETSPYVTPDPSAGTTVLTGAGELAGWYCSVADGNITIYDALSATGTAIVPATALVVGPMPIMGAGTTAKLALATGCHVVLSGAATVRVLVA